MAHALKSSAANIMASRLAELARQTEHAARDGRPGDDWPRYTPETPALKLFDREDRVAVDPEPHRRRAWGPHELVAAPP